MKRMFMVLAAIVAVSTMLPILIEVMQRRRRALLMRMTAAARALSLVGFPWKEAMENQERIVLLLAKVVVAVVVVQLDVDGALAV